MTYKEKLIELLCEVEEIKNDLMEIKFGTYISNELIVDEEDITIGKFIESWEEDGLYHYSVFSYDDGITTIYTNEKEQKDLIIVNPLEERHIRMYCLSKGLNLICNSYGEYTTQMRELFVELDNTKSFDSQSDEVYEKIYNFLSK